MPSTWELTWPTRRSSKRTSPVSVDGDGDLPALGLHGRDEPAFDEARRRAHEAHLVAALVALERLLLVLAGEGDELLDRAVEVRRLLRLRFLRVALVRVRGMAFGFVRPHLRGGSGAGAGAAFRQDALATGTARARRMQASGSGVHWSSSPARALRRLQSRSGPRERVQEETARVEQGSTGVDHREKARLAQLVGSFHGEGGGLGARDDVVPEAGRGRDRRVCTRPGPRSPSLRPPGRRLRPASCRPRASPRPGRCAPSSSSRPGCPTETPTPQASRSSSSVTKPRREKVGIGALRSVLTSAARTRERALAF